MTDYRAERAIWDNQQEGRMRGRRQRWGVMAVVAAAAVLVTVSGCNNELLDVEENGSEPETYTVTFEKQGGIGGSTSVTATVGSPMPFATGPTRAGQVFHGYYTAAEGKGTQYYTAEMASARNWDVPANTELIAYWIYIGGPGPAGGIVFYDKGAYSDGWRYLEAAPASTEWTNKPWGGYGTLVGGTGTAIGSGSANTEAIVTAYGNEEPDEGRNDYAARVAADLSFGRYDDWFLPSWDELDLMSENLHGEGIGGFASAYYWSSSENDKDYALAKDFDFGSQVYALKHPGYRVRAARAF